MNQFEHELFAMVGAIVGVVILLSIVTFVHELRIWLRRRRRP